MSTTAIHYEERKISSLQTFRKTNVVNPLVPAHSCELNLMTIEETAHSENDVPVTSCDNLQQNRPLEPVSIHLSIDSNQVKTDSEVNDKVSPLTTNYQLTNVSRNSRSPQKGKVPLKPIRSAILKSSRTLGEKDKDRRLKAPRTVVFDDKVVVEEVESWKNFNANDSRLIMGASQKYSMGICQIM